MKIIQLYHVRSSYNACVIATNFLRWSGAKRASFPSNFHSQGRSWLPRDCNDYAKFPGSHVYGSCHEPSQSHASSGSDCPECRSFISLWRVKRAAGICIASSPFRVSSAPELERRNRDTLRWDTGHSLRTIPCNYHGGRSSNYTGY